MIDYEKSLNEAQYAAVTVANGPVLVVAGAGSGKTRTIVYRLAWLAEHGIDPHAMLLLTFTRKAAQEMLHRASHLLGQGLAGVQGGTFHGFAFAALRQYPPEWLEGRTLSIMDSADISAAVKYCKEELRLGKGDRSFPKTQNIVGILSKVRNKELPLDEVLRRDACHLLPHAQALAQLEMAYTAYRREKGLLDYDDLLFELEKVLREHPHAAQRLRERFSHVMVDEYQDTNKVQARLVRLLARPETSECNVMAVGDEAQSIYAFRGADVRNILDFPHLFPEAQVIRLEENYRSTQQILDIANALLENAQEGYRKRLFTRRGEGETVRYVIPASDISQGELVARRVQELLGTHLPHEIAVLFRAGFHSYHLEMALNRAGILFRKYGGLKYTEAAHVKDVLSYARLVLNPLDMPAFGRIADLHSGIGPKTVQKLYGAAMSGDPAATEKAFARFPSFLNDMRFLDGLREHSLSPVTCLGAIVDHYRPQLETHYPDDWPRRLQGLEEIMQMASGYTELDVFMADMALESPEEDENIEGRVTLSTVHSAKGLEWNAVILLDLVEDRFPSRHAVAHPEDFEEERRLMYVACTRARRTLDLCVPASLYSRSDQGLMYASPSPFVRELSASLYERWKESSGGQLGRYGVAQEAPRRLLPPLPQSSGTSECVSSYTQDAGKNTLVATGGVSPAPAPTREEKAVSGTGEALDFGYCRHRIFGRGKIIRHISTEKVQVNFPGFGVKTILAEYLIPEE